MIVGLCSIVFGVCLVSFGAWLAYLWIGPDVRAMRRAQEDEDADGE